MSPRRRQSPADKVFDNLDYRLRSLRRMLHRGVITEEGPMPVERQMEILRRRQNVLLPEGHTRRKSRDRSQSERTRSRRDVEEQADSEAESGEEGEAEDEQEEEDQETNQQEPDASKRVPPSFSEAAKNVR